MFERVSQLQRQKFLDFCCLIFPRKFHLAVSMVKETCVRAVILCYFKTIRLSAGVHTVAGRVRSSTANGAVVGWQGGLAYQARGQASNSFELPGLNPL